MAIFMLLMVGKINVNAEVIVSDTTDISGPLLEDDNYQYIYDKEFTFNGDGIDTLVEARLTVSTEQLNENYLSADVFQQPFQYLELELLKIEGSEKTLIGKVYGFQESDQYKTFLQRRWIISSPGMYEYRIAIVPKTRNTLKQKLNGKNFQLNNKFHVSTNKYNNFTVTKKNLSNGGVQYDMGVTDFDGSDSSQTWFLREDRDAKTIKLLAKSYKDNCNTSDVEPPWGTNITYYAIKENILKAKIPSLYNATSTIAMTSTIKNALAKYANSANVTTPAPGVGSAVSLKATPGIKSANLEWRGSTKSDVTYITGYQIKRYNSAGKNDASYTVTDSGQYSNVFKCTIPYEGTYYFTAKPYYTYKGKTYWGAETGKVGCASAKIYSPTCLATKISNKVAKVTVNVPEGANGTIIYQNVGGKWKEIGKTTYSKKYTVKKNTAGKRQYRVVSYVTDGGKTYYAAPSKAAKPQSNVCTCKYPKYAGGYKSASHFWRPIKISYSGNKVVVKGRFINTHIYRMDFFNIKLTVKAEGKVIGTKTIKCGRIKSKGTKVVTVKLDKSKKNMDLRNGNLYWSYKVIRADALN